MHEPILTDIFIILSLSIAVLLIFHKLKIHPILGFLLTGIIAGPYSLSLISNYENIETLAELGIILLLFSIGIEFSLKELGKLGKTIFFSGFLQVSLTIIAALVLAKYLGFQTGQAIFCGFLLSLSSTAILLKTLQERREIDSPHGTKTLAILIFQDIVVVPMMLITPLLTQNITGIGSSLLLMLGKGLLVIAIVLFLAKFVVPKLLDIVATTRSQELFLFAIVIICLAIASLTSYMGLSLPLGAFFAGLVISESQYSHQATGNIMPFNGIFTSIFFVSIGMLLNLDFFLMHWFPIVLITLAVIVLKSVLCFLAISVSQGSIRTALIAALSLSQIGEFSFILAQFGLNAELINANLYQYFLSISILSMALTPLIINFAHWISDKLMDHKLPYFDDAKHEVKPDYDLDDHLIIIGFGINGKELATKAKKENIQYLIVELNPETVKRETANNEPIIYGDALHSNILDKIQINSARVVLVAISDYLAARKIISKIRETNSSVYIIARTRYTADVEILKQLGADEVIVEQLEASKKILKSTLSPFFVTEE